MGNVVFEADGSSAKTIHLRAENQDTDFFNGLSFLGSAFGNQEDLRWDLRLSPSVPLTLNISGGVGKAMLDLSKLRIADFSMNGGVGEVNLKLPDGEANYNIHGGVGGLNISVAEGGGHELQHRRRSRRAEHGSTG